MAKAKLSPDIIEWSLKFNADSAAKEMHKLNERNRELAASMEDARKKMKKIEAEGGMYSKEWKKQNKIIQDSNNELATNKQRLQALDRRLNLNQRTIAELQKRLRGLQRELRNTSKATDPTRFRELKRDISATQRALDNATASSKGFRSSLLSLRGIKDIMAGFFMGIGNSLLNSVMGALRGSVNTIIDFEKQNSKLASILQSTKAGIKDMTDEARRLGATTSYTAAEVTSLQIELAKLGFNKEQIKGMEEAVLRFSLAVDTDLASAASLAGATLRIFGKEATDAESVLATLAIGTTSSALDFSYLATAMSIVGPVANAFGFTVEEVTALLGGLANAGFDASSAATACRNILLNMADSSGKLATSLGRPVNNLDDLAAGLHKLNDEGIDLARLIL